MYLPSETRAATAVESFECLAGGIYESHPDVDVDAPVQWFEAAGVQRQSVLGTGAVVDQPAADARAAVRVFTGRLEGALQHVSTHTTEETFVHVAHKPVQVVAHSARHACDTHIK